MSTPIHARRQVALRPRRTTLAFLGRCGYAAVFCAAIVGCGGSDEQPATPPSGSSPPLTPSQEQAIANAANETEGQGGLNVEQTILDLCPGVKPAYFRYNSSQVKTGFRDTLVALADCLKNGNLKDKKLLLVGHADPRGTDDYNLALGGRRAGSVQSALVELKVSRSQLETSSRGELDATGTTESGWNKDRRVDVKLLR